MGFTKFLKKAAKKYNDTSLILRIFIGLVAGAVLGLVAKKAVWIATFGDLFVSALKSMAPILVFVLCVPADHDTDQWGRRLQCTWQSR